MWIWYLVSFIIGISISFFIKKQSYKKIFKKEIKKQEEAIKNKIREREQQEEAIKNKIKEKEQLENELKITDNAIKERTIIKQNLAQKIEEIVEKNNQLNLDYSLNEQYFKEEKEEQENFLKMIEKEISSLKEAREKANSLILDLIRETEEKDFHRVILSKEDINDIIVLKELLPKIINKRAINQIIYDVYYKNPLKDMLNRVLEGKNICGIYKITNLNTNQAYIGKSVDLKKRWTEHIRSSLGLGTIAKTKFHNVLYDLGVENFSFEVLEECDREKLTEKEKFWIDFFNSKIVGYNSLK